MTSTQQAPRVCADCRPGAPNRRQPTARNRYRIRMALAVTKRGIGEEDLLRFLFMLVTHIQALLARRKVVIARMRFIVTAGSEYEEKT
jgi:hypothetical protein